MNMPVIVVSDFFEGLPKFINDIHEDVIVLIDEYEKIYSDWKTSSILTVMDGVLSGSYRRMFLLTTNDLHINENMLQRPSRIYYLKTFDNIGEDVVLSIVDDMLDYPEYRDDVVKFVSEMNIITIDLVKAIIKEVNLHNESPYEFKDIFNVRNAKNELCDLYDITDVNNPKQMAEGIRMDFQFSESNIGRDFYSKSKSFGTMIKVFDKQTALFENRELKSLNVAADDAEDEDLDKAKKANGGKVEYEMVRRVIRKEPSMQFNGIGKYII